MFLEPLLPKFSATTLIAGVAVFCFGIYAVAVAGRYQFSAKSPKRTKAGYPIIGAIHFFTARWDFFRHARQQAPTGNFSFFLGKHPVVGYAVLFGQSPNSLQDERAVANEKDFTTYFSRRLTRMLRNENFNKSLPKLMEDVQISMKKLRDDPSGITDPFESVYRIVYQLTIRMVGSDDIANDPELCEKTLQLYHTIENSSTAIAIMYPWFPSPAKIKRTIAAGRLYVLIQKIVDERKKSGHRGDDPLQYLMDEGEDVKRIIEFVIGALYAGLLNSGINVAWVLLYLSKDPYWMSKVREEVKTVAAKYCPDTDAPLSQQLTYVPVEAWESEFPALDLCLKDSIRLQLLGAAFRKNTSGREIPTGVGDEVIPPGAYVTYHTADVSLDPTIYPDPLKWDPARYLPDRAEDKKRPYAYIGWGVARHPCLGMRFAKLEQNLITAFFIANFDYELTDKHGNPLATMPSVDYNGTSATKPKPPIYFKYQVR
ncbi:hypothetical protein HYALB_00007535 [Hymenoscyphus albidus]|uniref:Cytochrome P450 6A1 n=1 Tax=Hymenoscyphus albidus TaxID=595503 RepID=A0A9N9LLN2_9HELO|nr:hypothetical protein HYALB_00007535 [Hymenoscyphus albidus]